MPLEGPAFDYPSTPPKAVTYKVHQAAIKWLANLDGMPPEWFSSHSLHRGGATFHWLTVGSLEELKIRGDWSSDAYMAYLSTPLEDRIEKDIKVASAFAGAVIP